MRSAPSRRSPSRVGPAIIEPASTLGDPLAIRLRDADHTYWHGDERVLGCNETLRELDLFDPSFYTDAGRDRGLRVHHRTAALDRGDAAAPPVLAEELGFCESWARLVALWQLQVLLAERALWDPVRRVAGTVDRVVLVRRRGLPEHLGVIDLKTGAEEPVHRYALSIYDLIVGAWLGVTSRVPTLPRERYAVYLRDDGELPRVRAYAFEPVVHALVATVQLKRLIAPRAR